MINGIIIVYFWYDWFIYKQGNKLLAPKKRCLHFFITFFSTQCSNSVFLFKEKKTKGHNAISFCLMMNLIMRG